MSLLGQLDISKIFQIPNSEITDNLIQRETDYLSWLIISTGITVPLLTADTLSPASQYDPFESTGSWVRGQGSAQAFFIVFTEAGVIFTFLKKTERTNKSTQNQWQLQLNCCKMSWCYFINTHDQKEWTGMDKDQRV